MSDAQQMQWRRWTFADRTAAECLAVATGLPNGLVSIGYAYTPDDSSFCVMHRGRRPGFLCRLFGARREDDAIRACSRDGYEFAVNMKSVFELRLFGSNAELRWERTHADKGRLTICTDDKELSELVSRVLRPFGIPEATERNVWPRNHRYLLWGQRAPDQPRTGWTKLTSAQIGALWIPCDLAGDRFVLTAREYFEEVEFGNVVFVGERLTGLREARKDDAEPEGADFGEVS